MYMHVYVLETKMVYYVYPYGLLFKFKHEPHDLTKIMFNIYVCMLSI